MSDFDLAIPTILRHEGGFVDNVSDPGGATNFGVSIRWLKSQGLLTTLEHEEGDMEQSDVQAVRNMSEDQAKAFYLLYWWNKYGYGRITAQSIATKLFDTAVNVGPSKAVKFAQQAAGAFADGILGPESVFRINAQPADPLLKQMQSLQASYYQSLVLKNNAEQKYLAGWLNRAFDKV